jgi:amidophosphoribosyltransferase
LEKIGHFLDVENEELYAKLKHADITNQEVYNLISERIDIEKILKKASEDWDGGYAMAGLFGHGDAFVLRDPSGIRPAYFYEDDEICVVASERPVIQTAFNIKDEDVKELSPGHALIIRKSLLDQSLPIPSNIYYDWWLALQALTNGGLQFFDEILVESAIHAVFDAIHD